MFDTNKKVDPQTLFLIEESLRLSPSSFGLEGRGICSYLKCGTSRKTSCCSSKSTIPTVVSACAVVL